MKPAKHRTNPRDHVASSTVHSNIGVSPDEWLAAIEHTHYGVGAAHEDENITLTISRPGEVLMRKTLATSITAAGFFAALSAIPMAQSLRAPDRVPGGSPPSVERGRYLIWAAGACYDCHGGKLEGGSLDFLAPNLPRIVQRRAPKIAGLAMFKDNAAATRFLETGELPGKRYARPPMPKYRFNHDDAVAMVAYLRTLR